MYSKLPEEIALKIMLYAHPSISEEIREEIRMYKGFYRNIKVKLVYCRICNRDHRIPKHFSC